MLSKIDSIRQSIRNAFYWPDRRSTPIYLIIDNTWGHGNTEAKGDHQKILKEKYNLIIDWQVANTTYTNMLHLGCWMAVQSEVEEQHHTQVMQNDILSKSINKAFENIYQIILYNIHKRRLKVLDLIIKDDGNNNLEKKIEEHSKKT